MEKVVRGLLLSSHPDEAKVAVLRQLLPTCRPTGEAASHALYRLASELLLGPTPEPTMGELLLAHLAGQPGQEKWAASFFSTTRLTEYLVDTTHSLDKVVHLLCLALTLKGKSDPVGVLRDSNALHSYLAPLLREFASPLLQVALAQLLVCVPSARPPAVDVPQVVLGWLTGVGVEDDVAEHADGGSEAARAYDTRVGLLTTLLLHTCNGREDKILALLVQVFIHLAKPASGSSGGIPSFALAAVLQNVPSSYIARAASLIAHPASGAKDAEVELALVHLISWPVSHRLGDWVIGLLGALAEAKRYSVVASLTAKSAHIAVNQMFVPELRVGALRVLRHLLLGYQHSPTIFHALLPDLTKLVAALAEQPGGTTGSSSSSSSSSASSADSHHNRRPREEAEAPTEKEERLSLGSADWEAAVARQGQQAADPALSQVYAAQIVPRRVISALLTLFDSASTTHPAARSAPSPAVAPWCPYVGAGLAELLHVLMLHYTGYPELYSPLLTALPQEPPSEADARKLISQHQWTTAEGVYKEVGNVLPRTGARGRTGLVNLGNTCYLNSALQALFMTDSLRDALAALNLPLRPSGAAHALAACPTATQLQRVFAYLLRSARGAYAPKLLRAALPGYYQEPIQHDASEFLKYLLDQLETELGATPQKALVSRSFGGTLTNRIICSSCGHQSPTKEAFTDLALPFDTTDEAAPTDLAAMLRSFLRAELLEGSNRYACPRCDALRDARKEVAVTSPPEHLVLTLKRFSYDYKTGRRAKILTPVRYPLSFSLPVLDHDALAAGVETVTEVPYQLYGVVMHSGRSAHHGHYYAYARPAHAPLARKEGPDEDSGDHRHLEGRREEEEERWYLFNDSLVQKSSYRAFSAISQKFSSDVPYLLFYARATPHAPRPDSAAATAATEVLPALAREVEADNARFLAEEEAAARRAAQIKKSRYAYARTSSPFYRFDEDDEDEWGGRGCGGKRFDDDFGGGAFGGFGPHFVS